MDVHHVNRFGNDVNIIRHNDERQREKKKHIFLARREINCDVSLKQSERKLIQIKNNYKLFIGQ